MNVHLVLFQMAGNSNCSNISETIETSELKVGGHNLLISFKIELISLRSFENI